MSASPSLYSDSYPWPVSASDDVSLVLDRSSDGSSDAAGAPAVMPESSSAEVSSPMSPSSACVDGAASAAPSGLAAAPSPGVAAAPSAGVAAAAAEELN